MGGGGGGEGAQTKQHPPNPRIITFTYFDVCSQATSPDVTDVVERIQYFLLNFKKYI